MRKQVSDLARNYVRLLSDSDLIWLYNKLHDRLGDDVAEAIQFMSKSSQIDRWFATSRTANELYDMVDIIQQYVEQDNRLLVSPH